MSKSIVKKLTEAEARSKTDAAKAKAAELWSILLELYDGEAHVALGYSSWGDYFEAEFDGSKTAAYQLIAAGRVHRVIPQLRNEAQARALAPLIEQPERMTEVWDEAVARHGEPTAHQLKALVSGEPHETHPFGIDVDEQHHKERLNALPESDHIERARELIGHGSMLHRLSGLCMLNVAAQVEAEVFLSYVHETEGEGNDMWLRVVNFQALAWFVQHGGENELVEAQMRESNYYSRTGKTLEFGIADAERWCAWAKKNWPPTERLFAGMSSKDLYAIEQASGLYDESGGAA